MLNHLFFPTSLSNILHFGVWVLTTLCKMDEVILNALFFTFLLFYTQKKIIFVRDLSHIAIFSNKMNLFYNHAWIKEVKLFQEWLFKASSCHFNSTNSSKRWQRRKKIVFLFFLIIQVMKSCSRT